MLLCFQRFVSSKHSRGAKELQKREKQQYVHLIRCSRLFADVRVSELWVATHVVRSLHLDRQHVSPGFLHITLAQSEV